MVFEVATKSNSSLVEIEIVTKPEDEAKKKSKIKTDLRGSRHKDKKKKGNDDLRGSRHKERKSRRSTNNANLDGVRSTHSSRGRKECRSVSDHGTTAKASARTISPRNQARQGRRHSTSEAVADSPSALSPHHHSTRRPVMEEKTRQDSRRGSTRQTCHKKGSSFGDQKPFVTAAVVPVNVEIEPPTKEAMSNVWLVPVNIEIEPTKEAMADVHTATKQRVRQDLAIKKLEMENQQLRDELEHARDIILQLREQQLEHASAGLFDDESEFSCAEGKSLPGNVKTKAKKTPRKSSFWYREKAAMLVGLEKRKSKLKKDALLLNPIRTPGKTPYSQVADTPDSNSSNGQDNSTNRSAAQSVASTLETQNSFRRSASAASAPHHRREMSPGDLQVLMTKAISLRRSTTQE